ncbi:hypothetical protein Tco_1109264 [Tanacetum coccineum]
MCLLYMHMSIEKQWKVFLDSNKNIGFTLHDDGRMEREMEKDDEDANSVDNLSGYAALWVELKRLFEPDTDDLLELQRYMHDPLTWRLYDTCGVHHVSTETGLDIFMIVEKDYPMTRGFPMLMLVNKLQVDQHSDMANKLLRKIFILANRPGH